MTWEKRERGGLYYTRTHRINGRKVREYVGTGLIGELAALEDVERRLQREQDRRAWEDERVPIYQREAELVALDAACRRLVEGALNAAGYYNHKGEWRKKHG
jgi:hypothetical protein